MNFYEALNLRLDATVDEIEEAYRRLARKVHPDVSPKDLPRAEARMKLLNQIRDTLTDPQRRAAYDADLQESASPSFGSQTLQSNITAVEKKRVSGWKLWAVIVVTLTISFVVGIVIFVHRGQKTSVAFDNQGLLKNEQPHNQFNANTLIPRANQVNKPSTEIQSRIHTLPDQRSKAKVVQVGSTVQDVLELLGKPDRVEEFPANKSRILYYGKLRFLVQDGRVAQGAIKD
jgi:curved DNA-binding protein CbpA